MAVEVNLSWPMGLPIFCFADKNAFIAEDGDGSTLVSR
jgi:hypothetical protein